MVYVLIHFSSGLPHGAAWHDRDILRSSHRLRRKEICSVKTIGIIILRSVISCDRNEIQVKKA